MSRAKYVSIDKGPFLDGANAILTLQPIREAARKGYRYVVLSAKAGAKDTKSPGMRAGGKRSGRDGVAVRKQA